jgi:hypothetical protein
VSAVHSVLLDLCVAGTHVHHLALFIRRNRYGRGKVLGAHFPGFTGTKVQVLTQKTLLGSFCGTLASYLQHYRRQVLSLVPRMLTYADVC